MISRTVKKIKEHRIPQSTDDANACWTTGTLKTVFDNISLYLSLSIDTVFFIILIFDNLSRRDYIAFKVTQRNHFIPWKCRDSNRVIDCHFPIHFACQRNNICLLPLLLFVTLLLQRKLYWKPKQHHDGTVLFRSILKHFIGLIDCD